MNPGFIPSDDVIQEVIAFPIVPLQKLEQICWRLRLCSSVRFLGTHLAAALWNPRMSCTKE